MKTKVSWARVFFLLLFAVLVQSSKAYSSRDYVENAYCYLGMKMIYVAGGSYDQGSPHSSTAPQRPVSVDGFWIGECEVTQEQWRQIMGRTIHEQRVIAERNSGEARPLRGVGKNYPMYNVSYAEAKEFCRRLSELTGHRYDLPTEAQWEYAARGGAYDEGYRYSGSDYLYDVAWANRNSGTSTHPVKYKRPNALGIYDMSGNVQEWCRDWYGGYSYSYQVNPMGPRSGNRRVVRGGCWRWEDEQCCVWYRVQYLPTLATTYVGFRVVRLY